MIGEIALLHFVRCNYVMQLSLELVARATIEGK